MAESRKRLILANGEAFATGVPKKVSARAPEPPRTYAEARDVVHTRLSSALDQVREMDSAKRFADEIILCLRMHPDATAKSYDPKQLFLAVPSLDPVGSRTYTVPTSAVKQTARLKKRADRTESPDVSARLVFTRGSRASFEEFLKLLDRRESSLRKDFCNEVRRIEAFDLLTPAEQLLGFAEDWQQGRVEIVFHPSARHDHREQVHFLEGLFPQPRAMRSSDHRLSVAPYRDGPTFVSCFLNRLELEALAGANPLRAVHPMEFRSLGKLRGSKTYPAPQAPASTPQSAIKIGLFDGGVDVNHPLLFGHVEEDESLSISSAPDPEYVEHGIAVAGTILYGPLNEFKATDVLPAPAVAVVSIRALPCSDGNDPDLYEAIDVIENAVPARPDISTYNLSFGPVGPILDDSISRFTYSLDLLSERHNVGFFVAVGNDGGLPDGSNRIQTPADLVNGIGVGAHTRRSGAVVHASYSCRGPGRECGKVKPEVVAFGGCDQSPIHLVSATPGLRVLNEGTSFAAPAVAAIAGRFVGTVERATPLLARALLVHTASHPDGVPDSLLGYGVVEANFDELVGCDDKSFTVVYQGAVSARKYVKLPFLIPPDFTLPGRVRVTWTVAVLAAIDPNHPSEYTLCGVEDTFYPHARRYKYTSPKDASGKSTTVVLANPSPERLSELQNAGWRQSEYPATRSPKRYDTEEELRSTTLKWESLVHRSESMMGSSLQSPFLLLHAISRNRWDDIVQYAVVATVHAPQAATDLYAAVLRMYPALQPIRLRSEAEIRIQL